MLHRSTEVRVVNPEIGYGVFATEPIPQGTIVMFEDPFDIKVTPEIYTSLHEEFRAILEFFGYVNLEGNAVFSWDNARYINHSCDANTLPTGYMLVIAIRDIAEGEEITLDYGLLDACFKHNERTHALCMCGVPNCRKEIHIADPKIYLPIWISRTTEAFNCVLNVKQPLLEFMESERKENFINALRSNHDSSQLMLNLIQRRQANFYGKWGKLLAEKE